MIVSNLDIAQNSVDVFRVYTRQRFNKLYMSVSYIYIYVYVYILWLKATSSNFINGTPWFML